MGCGAPALGSWLLALCSLLVALCSLLFASCSLLPPGQSCLVSIDTPIIIVNSPLEMYLTGKCLPIISCDYTDSVAHFRHLHIFRSTNEVSTSHGTLVSVVVGGREARTCFSPRELSRLLYVSRRLSEPCSNTLVGANPSDAIFAGAVVLPYTLSSQSSTITSLVILGKRASSRMVYLSSPRGSAHNKGPSAFVSSLSKDLVSIMYFYNRFHRVIRQLGVPDTVLPCSDYPVLLCVYPCC